MGIRAWRAAALILALLPPVANEARGATSWRVSTEVELRGTYNDNVTQSAGDGEHDFITQVTPGLRIEGAGPRLRAHLNYAPSAIFYARHDEADNVANRLTAFASLEAIEKFFFLDVDGNISQQFLSPFAARPGDITTITDNRNETRSFGISPHVRGRLGSLATYQVRNRNLWTTSEQTELTDVYTQQWNASVQGPMRRFGWALELDDTRIEYDENFVNRPEQHSTLARARLLWRPDVSWQVSASAGRERNNYIAGEERYSDMHGAGLVWSPSVRTSLDLAYEKRFFGPSRLARFKHRTRLTAWELSYSKDVSSYQQEALRLPPGSTTALLDAIFAARIPDPAQRAAAIEQFLRNSGTPLFLSTPLGFFTQQVFLNERLEGSVGILGVRHSITLSVYASESSSLSEGIGALLPELGLPGRQIRQHGAGLSGSHRLTPFTTLTATANRTFAREEEPVGRESRNDNLSVSASMQLGPNTHTFAGIMHTRFKDEGVEDREGNSIFAGLTHRF